MKMSGVFVTTMPAPVAASTSTMSTPTEPTPMTTQRDIPAMIPAVSGKPHEVMTASASWATARNSSSLRAAHSTMTAPSGASDSSSQA